jgi:zinc protease
VPLVYVEIAARTGSADDPRGQEGLLNLAAELARRGAAGRSRQALDEALDALGAELEVRVDPDAVTLVGRVLSRNLTPFLRLAADIVLRPDFTADELARTRREVQAQIEEQRNDDPSLCARFFERRLYGDHPYGRAPDGTEKSLARVRRETARERFRGAFVGRNLIFAAAGDVTPDTFRAQIGETFAALKPGPAASPSAIRTPLAPEGWRILVVDKPDRQQTQIMIGPRRRAGRPRRLSASDDRAIRLRWPGHEVHAHGRGAHEARARLRRLHGRHPAARAERRARLGVHRRRAHRHHPQARAAPLPAAHEQGPDARARALLPELPRRHLRLRHGRPERRLAARVSAELYGLPDDWVDTYVDRLKAVTPEQVAAAIKAHVHANNLAITLVATADEVLPLLIKSGIAETAIDVVKYDSY